MTHCILTWRFSQFVDGLLRLVGFALRHNPLPAELTVALTNRIQRLRKRFEALLAQFRAGTLPPPRPARASHARTASAKPRLAIPAPHRIAALLRPIPDSAWLCRCHIAYVVDNDAEARALAEVCPAAARILRASYRLVGLKPPAWLALPRRPRKPRERKPRPRRLGRMAYANEVHPDDRQPQGLKPPNRIGYAKADPWPKDYRPDLKKDG